MIKFVPFFILFFIICFLATPTNSLAPDVHTGTVNNDYQSFLNKVLSFLRDEDLFWWRENKFVYPNNIDEDALSNNSNLLIGDKKIDSRQLEKFQGTYNSSDDPFDSMSIWREWYRLDGK